MLLLMALRLCVGGVKVYMRAARHWSNTLELKANLPRPSGTPDLSIYLSIYLSPPTLVAYFFKLCPP